MSMALHSTESLENDNDNIIIKIQFHGTRESVTINGMVHSGSTENFIDKEVCNKDGIKIMKGKNPGEI